MKIKYCLLSCDDNPLYLDFWPLTSKIWKSKFNINPILVYLGNNTPNSYYGEIISQPLIPNIPIYIQSQLARFYYTSNFINDVCITSDIDMFPISKQYFINQLVDINEESYAHLYPNSGQKILPTCYHVAKGKTFKNYLNLPTTFQEFASSVYEFGKEVCKNLPTYWAAEETYITYLLKNKLIINLPRWGYNRLDRSNWVYNKEDIINEIYIDCHCARPYNDYKESIDDIVNILCS